MDDLKIFTGRAHPELAKKVCDYLGIPVGKAQIGSFPDGEISCKIDEDIRGRDVFIVQPTCPPVNDNLMELLVMVDSCMRASAERITAVIPYFGYARQDRKDEGRVPITAKLVANMITACRHQPRAGDGPARCPNPGLFRHPRGPSLCRAGDRRPDQAAGIQRGRTGRRQPRRGQHQAVLAHLVRLGGTLAIIDKRRSSAEKTKQAHVIGSQIEGRLALIFDDMISTGGSICGAAAVMRNAGRGKSIWRPPTVCW